jgi:hypothetical protein
MRELEKREDFQAIAVVVGDTEELRVSSTQR